MKTGFTAYGCFYVNCTSLGRMAWCGCPSQRPTSISVVTVDFMTLMGLKELDVIPPRWSDEEKTCCPAWYSLE